MPLPVATAATVGSLFPGPYRVPRATFTTQVDLHQHRRSHARTAARGSSRSLAREILLDIAARQMGIDPVELRRRNLLRTRRAAVHQPERHDVRLRQPARDVRAGRRDARLRRLPPRAGRRRASRPLPRRRHVAPTSSRRRRARDATAPRAPRSASNRRARSTCTSRAARPATASRRRSCSSPPTPSASTSTTSPPSRATPRVTGSARAPAGSRSGSMTGRRGRRDRVGCCVIASSPSPRTAGSRARRHRDRRQPRECARHADEGHDARRDRRRSRTSSPTRCRPACPPGLEASAPLHRRAPVDLGERDARVHVRGRHRHRQVTLLRYIVERGLRRR